MVGPHRSAVMCIYLGGIALPWLPPLSALADLNGRDQPAWCWLMARLEEQYFVIVIRDYLRTTCFHVFGL